jgi:hypothetical protein
MIAFPVLEDSADVAYQRLHSRTKRTVEAAGVVARENFDDDDNERECRRVDIEGRFKFRLESGQYCRMSRLSLVRDDVKGERGG